MFAGPSVQIKLHLPSIVLLNEFQTPQELWNPVSEAVLGKFHGCGGRIKRNCLPDRTSFHRYGARQIIIIFNTGIVYIGDFFLNISITPSNGSFVIIRKEKRST